jgi:hypothetical protein
MMLLRVNSAAATRGEENRSGENESGNIGNAINALNGLARLKARAAQKSGRWNRRTDVI